MLASAVVLGLAGGVIAGGRLERIADLRLTGWPVLLGSVLLRFGAAAFGDLAPYAYVAAFAGIVAVALANRALPGAWAIAAGAFLNLVVVAANGGMPVSPEALASVGGISPSDALHREIGPGTRLAFLADVIPFPIGTAYSVGDVLIAIGGSWLAFRQVRPR